MLGKRHSIETKLKMSEAKIGSLNHQWIGGKRFDENGYILVNQKNHPRANSSGYVYEHRLVMEKKIGRYLTRDEVVHHINEIKDDNRPENLMLFSSVAEHQSFHKKQEAA